jgi:hypothetical protein
MQSAGNGLLNILGLSQGLVLLQDGANHIFRPSRRKWGIKEA